MDVQGYLNLVPTLRSLPGGSLWSSYDAQADTLYVNFKKPACATDSELTPDDIIVRFGPGRGHSESLRVKVALAQINATGYGLTLGVHSRNEETARRIEELARVGNLYVNRNQIGAVVGVQPFGGCGLSGTGPKAGGPSYLLRFANERTTSVNTTAVGGNASLLSLNDA